MTGWHFIVQSLLLSPFHHNMTLLKDADFQAGPTFPTIPTFFVTHCSLLFSKNVLLSLLFSPKMFEVTKNYNSFPHSLRLLGVCKNQIILIWAATMQKFIKKFSSVVTPLLENLFWYFFSMVMQCYCSEKTLLILSFSKSENTQYIPTIPTFHDWIPSFVLLFQNFEPYFIPTFSMEGTWKHEDT